VRDRRSVDFQSHTVDDLIVSGVVDRVLRCSLKASAPLLADSASLFGAPLLFWKAEGLDARRPFFDAVDDIDSLALVFLRAVLSGETGKLVRGLKPARVL
jgi:hypothetical protein